MFCDIKLRRIAVKALMILMFTAIAVLLLNTLLSIAIPFSVNANGNLRVPPQLDVAICDFNSAGDRDEYSSCVSWNIKSSGKRSMLRFTCSFMRLVSTPYNKARSLSIITCCPRNVKILSSIVVNDSFSCFSSVSIMVMY